MRLTSSIARIAATNRDQYTKRRDLAPTTDWILFLVILVLTIFMFYGSRRSVHYER